MTIFHLITHFDVGGAERIAINLAKATEGDVHIIEIARREGDFPKALVDECQMAGIAVHRASTLSNKSGILMFPSHFNTLIGQYKPDVIHVHTEVPDLALSLFKVLHPRKVKGTRIVRTIHNTKLWSRWRPIGMLVENWYQHIHANVSISKSVSESYRKEWRNEPEALIYNGVPEVRQIPFEGIIRQKVNILFAGRLEPYKGVKILIDIVKSFPQIEFHICGSGSMRGQIVEQLSDCANAHIYDAIPSLASKMSSFDYLFMPSFFEGLALCPIEASMAGCPVIANNCPGLGETLPSDWPLLVENNSIEDYRTIFSNIDSLDRRSLAQAAKEFAMEHFSIDKMVSEYNAIYRR